MTLNDYKAYRQALYPIYRLKRLRNNPTRPFNWAIIGIYGLLIALMVIILASCAQAQEIPYTDTQYVNAIYLAEGGTHAQFSYGIRSIHCKNEFQARKICFQTVKNNKRRFKTYGYKKYGNFLDFLASRYCPTTGRTLSKTEKRLNKNWIKNVEYFLEKGQKALRLAEKANQSGLSCRRNCYS